MHFQTITIIIKTSKAIFSTPTSLTHTKTHSKLESGREVPAGKGLRQGSERKQLIEKYKSLEYNREENTPGD